MRRLAIGSLVVAGFACSVTPAIREDADEAAVAPPVFVEAEPVDGESDEERSEWSGVWQEYFPGRPCQDTFDLRVEGEQIHITLLDCADKSAYAISDVRWDGVSLEFLAVSQYNTRISYSVRWIGPGQIVGTADHNEITWTRTMY